MFLREVKRENRNGTQVSYLQLVHNDWDPAARTSRSKICECRCGAPGWRTTRLGAGDPT